MALSEAHTNIALVVTDVIMPGGFGGRKTAEAVLGFHPQAEVLYMSGYTDDTVIQSGVLREVMNFLQKPYSPQDLASKVREVLDGSASPTHLPSV